MDPPDPLKGEMVRRACDEDSMALKGTRQKERRREGPVALLVNLSLYFQNRLPGRNFLDLETN